MTPDLINLRNEYHTLTTAGKELFDRMFAYSYNEANRAYARTTSNLHEFINTTIAGQDCIGFGSTYMVVSADYYLKLLGQPIADFDITKFQTRSTHR
jgi:hypothetical protein